MIPLPSEGETGYMEVYQDGKRIESGTVDFNTGTYSMEITATGQTLIIVNMDQEPLYNETIDMDSAGERHILSRKAAASNSGTAEDVDNTSSPDSGGTASDTGETYLDPEDEPGYFERKQAEERAERNNAIASLMEALFGVGSDG